MTSSTPEDDGTALVPRRQHTEEIDSSVVSRRPGWGSDEDTAQTRPWDGQPGAAQTAGGSSAYAPQPGQQLQPAYPQQQAYAQQQMHAQQMQPYGQGGHPQQYGQQQQYPQPYGQQPYPQPQYAQPVQPQYAAHPGYAPGVVQGQGNQVVNVHVGGPAYVGQAKSVGVAYLLWFFFGLLGIHKFYLGNVGMGILWLLTGGLLGFGLLYDLFTLSNQTTQANRRIAAGF